MSLGVNPGYESRDRKEGMKEGKKGGRKKGLRMELSWHFPRIHKHLDSIPGPQKSGVVLHTYYPSTQKMEEEGRINGSKIFSVSQIVVTITTL